MSPDRGSDYWNYAVQYGYPSERPLSSSARENIFDNFLPLTRDPVTATQGAVNIVITVTIMLCAVIVLAEAMRRWYKVLAKGEYTVAGQAAYATEKNFCPPEYGCC